MKPAAPKQPVQSAPPLAPCFVVPMVITAKGGGEFTATPGKPVEYLSPKLFAAQFGVDRDSVYRWMKDGTLPASYIKPGGKRRHLIHASAVQLLRDFFSTLHEAETKNLRPG
ncbi:MAG: hypothetical protein JWQ04_2614 [Pedosphaera sp.]|nr:hypothetical protein [Pedosphaera sp.]